MNKGKTMNLKKVMKQLIHKLFHHKHKFVNGSKGVISIFLAILMVPFASIAAALINAARVNSAVAVFDEALCNASNSTLGTYEEFLKKRFGLLAISQNAENNNEGVSSYTTNEFINETFKFYLEENQKSLSNTYTSYESDSQGVFPLADQNVLLSEILEYSKYSVPTKLVEDGLDIDDLIDSIEDAIPGSGIFNLISSGVGVADKMVTLGKSFDKLKDAVDEGETANNIYKTKYNEFESSVSNYVDTYNEMQKSIKELNDKYNSENNKYNNSSEQIKKIENEIRKLNEEKEKISVDKSLSEEKKKEQIEKIDKDIQKKEEEKETSQNEKNTAELNRNKVQSSMNSEKNKYNNKLNNQRNEIINKKVAYSSAISEFASKLSTIQSKLTTVQSDINNLNTSVTGYVSESISVSINSSKDEVKNKRLDLEKKLAKETDDNKKKEYQKQIEAYKTTEVNLSNTKTVNEKAQSSYKDGMKEMNENIADFNEGIYASFVSVLTTLKGKVDNYDTNSITGKLNKSEYYKSVDGILSSETVKHAEEEMVSEYAKSSVWSIIKTIIGFFQALCSMTTLYDSQLSAVINKSFYNDNYGGLPSEKDRAVHPLYYGEDGDSELSQHYKDILGEYSAQDLSALGSFDLIETLKGIVNDIDIISENVASIIAIVGLLNFAQTFKNICNAIEHIINSIKDIINYFVNAIAGSTFYEKLLLTGYVQYMTSDRTTYEKSCLTGASFNMRDQDPSTKINGNPISDLVGLVSTITKAVSGGSEKAFVGAEKEYIIYGSSSEIVNQTATFGTLYIIRILMNLYAIFTSGEVASIAAACTIASPVVYLIYILIEPLIDTIILVNGGEVPIFKTLVYLTPSGIDSLVKHFSKIALNKEQTDKLKSDFLEGIGQTKYAEVESAFPSDDISDTETEDGKSILQIDYSKNLFILMTLFVSRDRILERLSNIIEMETNEYLKDNGKFDLDYSYTYIRTEASFTTNEFISLSNRSGLKSKQRIVYRGY